MLQNSRIQNSIAQTLVRQLSEKLQTKVEIGKIHYKLFNTIAIDDVYLEDQQQDTLLYVKSMDAHFNLWKFFRGKYQFRSIDLDQLYGNIAIDKAGKTNFDFIVQAFKKPQGSKPANIEFQITRFKLKNSSFRFVDARENHSNSQTFNPKHLYLTNINSDIHLDIFHKDTIKASINHLSAYESSGLTLKDLRTKFSVSDKNIDIPYFDLWMPNSKIHFDSIQVNYAKFSDLKNLNENVKLKIPLRSSYFTFSDFAAFVPAFANLNTKMDAEIEIDGRISSLKFNQIRLKFGNSFLLNAKADFTGLPNMDETFIYANINDLHFERNDLQDFVAGLTKKPFVLPKELNQLGMVRYNGNISGFLNNLVAYGKLRSNVGTIATDILLQYNTKSQYLAYNGTIKSDNIQLNKILSNNQFGLFSFNFNTKGEKQANKNFQGTIEADIPEFQWNGYSYRDMQLKGNYDGSGFDGTFDVADENIDAHFTGIVDMTKRLPVFDFSLNLAKANLNALKLTTKYSNANLSFNARTNMIGNSPDNLNGFVLFDKIAFTNRNRTLNAGKIQFVSRTKNDETYFLISSDYVNGSISGNFIYSSLDQTFKRLAYHYLPALSNKIPHENSHPNFINVDLKISDTGELTDILELPWQLKGNSYIKGYYDEKNYKIDFTSNFPYFKFGKREFENIFLSLQNEEDKLSFITRAQMDGKNKPMHFYINATASDNSVNTLLGWQNSDSITNAGEFKTLTKFAATDGKINAQISVLPSQIILMDSVLNIFPSVVEYNSDGSLQVNNFKMEGSSQFLHVNGIASKSEKDSLQFAMNNLDLYFIMNDLVKLKDPSLGGYFTGNATMYSTFQQPFFEAKLLVKDFSMNQSVLGDADLYSYWDKEKKEVVSNANIINNKDTVAYIDGVYVPGKDSIDFVYDMHHLNAGMLKRYFGDVVQNVKGFATGKLRMFGPTKKMRFDGDLYVDEGQLKMALTQTTYFFNDTIRMKPTSVEFKNIKMYDEEGNEGVLDGIMKHTGMFGGLKYDVMIRSNNILALNTHANDNEIFYGKAYAGGTVHIFGDVNVTNVWVDVVSRPGSKCYVTMPGSSTAADNSFVQFVNKNDTLKSQKDEQKEKKQAERTSNTKVNLQIGITPDAEIQFIIDPKAGDMIVGKGTGNLRFEFDTYSDIKLFGTYTIEKGTYLFTLQNVIRKEFKIDEGSTLTWTGDLYNAQVKIKGIYSLTASLRDLMDASQLSSLPRTSVPVNCILLLSGDLMKPNVEFNIDLPSSDESVKQMVKSTISTNEMMARQIVYLLIFNKFYNPYQQSATNSPVGIGSSEAVSLVVSTLSAQMNNWLAQMINSNIISIGFDYRQTDQLSSDVQAQFLIQPNNRLIINGNLGYRNDNVNLSNNTNKFIGDIDVEWLLTEGGKFRLKAYNHTIDRYQLRSAKNTQGIGLIYKEDFSNFDELFRYYWNILTFKKKTNETNQ